MDIDRRSRRRWLALFAIIAGLLILLLAQPGCPVPDFNGHGRTLGPAEARVGLPVFVMPNSDIDAGNGIEAVFVDASEPERASVTVVFADEDHPLWLVDECYDLVRWVIHGRAMDVETFWILYAPGEEAGEPRAETIYFPTMASGDQTFYVKLAVHHEARVPWSEFERLEGRPILYVNTWNHMFSEADTNSDLKLVRVADYPVYRGDRAEVEAIFEAARHGE